MINFLPLSDASESLSVELPPSEDVISDDVGVLQINKKIK